MAQTVVPKFYSTRKKLKDPVKNIKSIENEKLSNVLKDPESSVIVDVQKSVQKASKSKTKAKKVNRITSYLKSEPGTKKTVFEKGVVQEKRIEKEVIQEKRIEKEVIQEKCRSPCTTPKRNLPSPEELTPSKKPLISREIASTSKASPLKSKSSLALTPKKQDSTVRRNLHLGSPSRYGSPKKFGSPLKNELTPQKAAVYGSLSNKDLAAIVNESRSKILFSGKLEELKKSLETFQNVASKTKEFQSNSFKITSVVSSAKSSEKEPTSVIQGEPAYKKFSYLAAPKAEDSLTLPYKYKLLGETFRCLDTVVKMINNRKEKITFEKVKGGVQDMIKKNFLMEHLGQIMTVFPKAYSLQYEKCDSYTINKKSSPYHLVITPNLSLLDGNSSEAPSKVDKKNNQNAFVYMTPQHLLERRHMFDQNLLEITRKHHQGFLRRCNFPSVPDEKIVRWHPNFPVDSVPNIPVGALPEEPEVKVCTARDVLNKIKGSVRGRVEKALQSVADEQKTESKEKTTPETDSNKNTQNKKQNSALKGICTDLLEKIRARESAKIIETMTRSATDEKRLAMLERVPKIVHILWHYFIAERKAAVPIDVAVDKIIHSFNTLTTPDAVKEHLELIRETMPGWLSLIKISKGEYITIDKKKDINVMLDNIK